MAFTTKDNQQTRPGFTIVGGQICVPFAFLGVAFVVSRPTPTELGDTATMIAIQPIGGDVLYTLDGTSPIALTTGFKVVDGAGAIVPMSQSSTFTVIADSGTPRLDTQWGR